MLAVVDAKRAGIKGRPGKGVAVVVAFGRVWDCRIKLLNAGLTCPRMFFFEARVSVFVKYAINSAVMMVRRKERSRFMGRLKMQKDLYLGTRESFRID